MSRLVVSEFLTLDGVMEDPGGSEGHARGGWALEIDRGPEGDQFKLDEVVGSEALLLGRATYEGFAEAWPSRTDDIGFADKMNNMRKYVVSTTLDEVDWNNSTLIDGEVAEEVSKLKQQPGGDILVAGSGELVNTLLRHGLVDELRLMVFPLVLGTGRRLFGEGSESIPLQLVESKAVGSGVLILVYRPAS